MKTPIAALAVAALSLALGTSAKAQSVVYEGSWGTAPGVVVVGPTFADPNYVPPYSYYAVFPEPARGYVGYGTNDFAYYGRPYGSPSDRWSWDAMTTAPGGSLARYYYPPVR